MRDAYRIAVFAAAAALGTLPTVGRAQRTVEVTLLSNSIELDTHRVRSGRVTLDVTNSADNKMMHELVVLKTDIADSALPVRNAHVLEQKLRKIGEVEDVAPGKSKRVTFRLTSGRYVLICNKPGHYAAGMRTVLVVAP